LLGVLSAPARFDPWWLNSAVDNFPLYLRRAARNTGLVLKLRSNKKQNDFNNLVEKKNES
jgi:hypothetical protein